MQPKQQSNWQWWLVLLVGAWLAAGQPGVSVLPIGGRAPFAVPDGKPSVVVVGRLDAMTRGQLTAEGLAHKAADAAKIRYRHWDPTASTVNDADWVRNASLAPRGEGPWLLISDGKGGESLALPADPTPNIQKYGG